MLPHKSTRQNNSEIFIDRVISFVSLSVAMASIGLSVYYSVRWFEYIGMGPVVAWTSSLSYILFINMVFEGAVDRITKGNSLLKNLPTLKKQLLGPARLMLVMRYITGAVLFVLWGAMVSYSMISTIGGQYDQLVSAERSREDTTYVVDTSASIDNAKEKRELWEGQKKSFQDELGAVTSRVVGVDSVEERFQYMNTTGGAENRADELRAKIAELDDKIINSLDSVVVLDAAPSGNFSIDSGSVYVYFSRVSGADALSIQFFLSLFPSLFIDIISPVSLAVFLFRKKKKRGVK